MPKLKLRSGDGFGSMILLLKGGEGENHQCILDTQGVCLFCLSTLGEGAGLLEGPPVPKSLEALEHYLEVKLQNVIAEKGAVDQPFLKIVAGKSLDFQATLCNQCLPIMEVMSGMKGRLQGDVEREVAAALLREVLRKVRDSEEEGGIYGRIQIAPKSTDEKTFFGRMIREEVMDKCSAIGQQGQRNGILRQPTASTSKASSSEDLSLSLRRSRRIAVKEMTPRNARKYEASRPSKVEKRVPQTSIKSKAPKENKKPEAADKKMKNVTPSSSSRKVNTASGLLTCVTCTETFPDKQRLRAHRQAVHFGDKKCTFCKKSFATPCKRDIHMQMNRCLVFNKMNVQRDSNTEPGEEYSFDLVPPSKLKQRMSTAMSKAAWNPETGKYECHLCTKKFAGESGLRYHFDGLHLQLKYRCVVCKKEFVCRTSFNHHFRSVHKGIIFTCVICHKSLSSEGELKKHREQVHLGIAKHGCRMCGKKYHQRIRLAKHMLRIHDVPVDVDDN